MEIILFKAFLMGVDSYLKNKYKSYVDQRVKYNAKQEQLSVKIRKPTMRIFWLLNFEEVCHFSLIL